MLIKTNTKREFVRIFAAVKNVSPCHVYKQNASTALGTISSIPNCNLRRGFFYVAMSSSKLCQGVSCHFEWNALAATNIIAHSHIPSHAYHEWKNAFHHCPAYVCVELVNYTSTAFLLVFPWHLRFRMIQPQISLHMAHLSKTYSVPCISWQAFSCAKWQSNVIIGGPLLCMFECTRFFLSRGCKDHWLRSPPKMANKATRFCTALVLAQFFKIWFWRQKWSDWWLKRNIITRKRKWTSYINTLSMYGRKNSRCTVFITSVWPSVMFVLHASIVIRVSTSSRSHIVFPHAHFHHTETQPSMDIATFEWHKRDIVTAPICINSLYWQQHKELLNLTTKHTALARFPGKKHAILLI